jgi:hypothetical protein
LRKSVVQVKVYLAQIEGRVTEVMVMRENNFAAACRMFQTEFKGATKGNTRPRAVSPPAEAKAEAKFPAAADAGGKDKESSRPAAESVPVAAAAGAATKSVRRQTLASPPRKQEPEAVLDAHDGGTTSRSIRDAAERRTKKVISNADRRTGVKLVEKPTKSKRVSPPATPARSRASSIAENDIDDMSRPGSESDKFNQEIRQEFRRLHAFKGQLLVALDASQAATRAGANSGSQGIFVSMLEMQLPDDSWPESAQHKFVDVQSELKHLHRALMLSEEARLGVPMSRLASDTGFSEILAAAGLGGAEAGATKVASKATTGEVRRGSLLSLWRSACVRAQCPDLGDYWPGARERD